MTAISTRTAAVTVEYEARGHRVTKTFADAHEGKRFYVAKEKAGKSPRIVPTAEAPAPSGKLPTNLSETGRGKHVAIYVRVSSTGQETKSQEPDLERWAAAQEAPVKWYRDTATGKNMDRPGWLKLEAAIRQGRVAAVVVWRIDRLGRTAKGLTALFDELRERKVNLVSLKDGLDLSTPAGRLMANVLASVAQYETEVRGERVAAGQARARAKGKKWGGSKPGIHKTVTAVQVRLIREAKARGERITDIAKAVRLSRPTVYAVLRSMPDSVRPTTSPDSPQAAAG